MKKNPITPALLNISRLSNLLIQSNSDPNVPPIQLEIEGGGTIPVRAISFGVELPNGTWRLKLWPAGPLIPAAAPKASKAAALARTKKKHAKKIA